MFDFAAASHTERVSGKSAGRQAQVAQMVSLEEMIERRGTILRTAWPNSNANSFED
jgi:hypothetical protein